MEELFSLIEDFVSRNFWWALLVCVAAGIPFSIIGWIAKKINKYFGILVQCGLSISLCCYGNTERSFWLCFSLACIRGSWRRRNDFPFNSCQKNLISCQVNFFTACSYE